MDDVKAWDDRDILKEQADALKDFLRAMGLPEGDWTSVDVEAILQYGMLSGGFSVWLEIGL